MSKTSVMLTGALLALSACAIEAQSNYSVTFPVGAKADNTMAYLVDWDSAQKIDSLSAMGLSDLKVRLTLLLSVALW